jgi:serine/threonine protein kinase
MQSDGTVSDSIQLTAASLNVSLQVSSPVAVGTSDYIAPEVLCAMDNAQGRFGSECDWWSLGCVMWEFLFGLPPFYADSDISTYRQIMIHVQKQVTQHSTA